MWTEPRISFEQRLSFFQDAYCFGINSSKLNNLDNYTTKLTLFSFQIFKINSYKILNFISCSLATLYKFTFFDVKMQILLFFSLKVPGEGVEPSRPKGHMALNHACLPIPAPGLKRDCKAK